MRLVLQQSLIIVSAGAILGIGLSFVALAAYVLLDAGRALYLRAPPERSVPGIVIAASSVVVMPLLARAKRRIGMTLGSRALTADAMQTSLCSMWVRVASSFVLTKMAPVLNCSP
jgi:divalent metal cation (Fe/Co/Zn/Cd) transporter